MTDRTPDAITELAREFNIDPYDADDIRAQLRINGTPEHVAAYTLGKVREMKRAGRHIRSVKGLFIALARKYHDLPEGAVSTSAPTRPVNSSLTVHGEYDFWFGDRAVSDATCQRIVWGYEADDPCEVDAALSLLLRCAPCIESHEAADVLDAALDLDESRGIIGPYAVRLAAAVRYVMAQREQERAVS